ncbi:unnamed protein product [Ectocarpus sp. CCAP 1310/34]|nr:unnamed protein product [Ectocarpus sp. CCAP 1310/34]
MSIEMETDLGKQDGSLRTYLLARSYDSECLIPFLPFALGGGGGARQEAKGKKDKGPARNPG